MCGISGFVLANGRPEQRLIEKMTDRLKTRGPDAGAVWIKENMALGHRRLKVIDLSDDANQPMKNAAGDVILVFNGEIYNFIELREELKVLGHIFRTSSDSEVLLQAYEAWGTSAFIKFNGMFAFAIADFRGITPQLFLVRDRWGIKPLFYSWQQGNLAFASTPGSLLELPWINKTLDREALAHYLRFAHFPQAESVYRDIRQVLPGNYFHLAKETLQAHRYYHPSEIIDPNNFSNPKDLDAILKRAVTRQMVSDTEVGCFLSGGIDSSLLVSYASQINPKLKTFSVGYAESAFDETPHAASVAKHFNTHHFSYKLSPQDLQKRAYNLPLFFDQPLGDPTILPTLFLAEYTSREVKVVLSGDGGDELFCGYPHQAALIKLKLFTQAPYFLRQMLTPSFLGKVGTLMKFQNEAEWMENFIGILGPLPPQHLQLLMQSKIPYQGVVDKILAEREMKKLPWPKLVEQVYLRTFLPDTVLAKTDRAGMAYGLEGRVPFLDDEVTQFAGSLKLKHKLDGLTSKAILRDLLRSKLPGNLYHRKKQGFSIPLRDWYRGPWRSWLEENLSKERLQKEGIFNGDAVAEIMREHQSGKINHSHLLWCLMSFQLWHEQQK